jgi:phospholipid/cholesterol/gamma-HCH transport system ATP-binding protein
MSDLTPPPTSTTPTRPSLPQGQGNHANAPVLVDVADLRKTYDGETWVLDGINLTVHEGETVAIIGTSGCGKSTLLRVLAGLDDYQEGSVTLHSNRFTLVFQYSALFDSLTVYENVAFSLLEPPDDPVRRKAFVRLSDAEIAAQVKAKLALLGLEGIEHQYPSELSGGMQKRVSFARGVMSNPNIIFYDEPTSGLDPVASNQLEDFINKLSVELNAASVVVTHTFSTICRTAHRVVLLHKGRIHWQGTPRAMLASTDPLVREFTQAATAVTCL